jgi:polyphenol oxidase
MFSLSKNNGIEYLQSPLLGHCDFLVHAFCTRHGGVSEGNYHSLNMSFREGDEEFHVLQNWGNLSAAFHIPVEKFLVLNQVHGNDIFVIGRHGNYFNSREELNYDAIVTNRANLAICIKTADCVPVFLVDRVKKVIAAVHAGWRGSALGIAAKAVRLMRSQYGSQTADLVAAIGPSIGPCCYEVDAATADQFRSHTNHESFLKPGKRKDRWMLNLVEVNRTQLREAGLAEEAIDSAGICTACRQDHFFSHRGSGGVTGRQINFLMIKGDPPCRVLILDDHAGQFH